MEETKKQRETVTVLQVKDGDTLEVKNAAGEIFDVRLIGVDAPEIDHEREREHEGNKADEYAYEAMDFTSGLAGPESQVELEYDLDETDNYGRTLAYVYLSSGEMLNLLLLQNGFGVLMDIGRNDAHIDEFRAAQKEAADQKLNIWTNRELSVVLVIDDRDNLYGPLKEHHLRIGDTQFLVPPPSISVTKRFKDEQMRIIRGKTSFMKQNGYFDEVIEISLFFPDLASINDELRPLLAQARKCPFLPVENTLLNDTYMIDAVTIESLDVQTLPEFPQSLVANLTMHAFNFDAYVLDEAERTYSEMIHWPLFRWYYSLNLQPNNRFTYLKPLDRKLDTVFFFRTANIEDLKQIRQWKKTRDKVIAGWMRDQKNKMWWDPEDDFIFKWVANNRLDKEAGEEGALEFMKKFFNAGATGTIETEWVEEVANLFSAEEEQKYGVKEYENWFDTYDRENFEHNIKVMYENEMTAYQVKYDMWNPRDIYLQQLSVSHQNMITPLQLLDNQSPTHQYMGSQDVYVTASFHVHGSEALNSFESMIKTTNYLAREYHNEMVSGYLQFSHPLTEMFGVENVAIKEMKSSTIDGYPDMYEVELTMIAFNRLERKAFETKKLADKIEWDIDENAGWLGKYVGAWSEFGGEFLTVATQTAASLAMLKVSPWLAIGFYALSTYGIGKTLEAPFMTQIVDHDHTFTKDALKYAKYQQSVMDSWVMMELYPDLELPTYQEVKDAGFEVTNTNDGAYVDPDFFILYNNPFAFRNHIIDMLNDPEGFTMKDQMGQKAELTKGGVLFNETAREMMKKSNEKVDAIKYFTNDFEELKEDEKEFTTEQIEAMIRIRSKEYYENNKTVLTENPQENSKLKSESQQMDEYYLTVSLAIAKYFDPELKQYYRVGANQNKGFLMKGEAEKELIPIMMTKNKEYYTDVSMIKSKMFIGVMRVFSEYSADAKIQKSTEANITAGVNRIGQIYSDSFSDMQNIDKKMFEDRFDLSFMFAKKSWETTSGNSQDEVDTLSQVRLIYTIMHYLDMQNDFFEISKGKKGNNAAVETVQGILDVFAKLDQWDEKRIQEEKDALPIHDYKNLIGKANTPIAQPPMEFEELISMYAGRFLLEENLVKAVIMHTSDFDPSHNQSGQNGLMGIRSDSNLPEQYEYVFAEYRKLLEEQQKKKDQKAIERGIAVTVANVFFSAASVSISATQLGLWAVATSLTTAFPMVANFAKSKNMNFDMMDINQNLFAGCAQLKYYLDKYGDEELALTAYYAGEDALANIGIVDGKDYTDDKKKMVKTLLPRAHVVNAGSTMVLKKSFDSAVENLPLINKPERLQFKTDPTESEFVENAQKYAFHDTMFYDKRNRLVRAFPTYFLVFIDEGQYLSYVKMQDAYFGFRNVMDITYINSRKNSASTLYLELNNAFGTLSDATKSLDYTNVNVIEMFNSFMLPGVKAAYENNFSRNRHPNWYRTINMQTGARVHFRMGYGSNPLEIPTLINGTVTEVENLGETVSIVVQSDGIELSKKLNASPGKETESFFFSSKEPIEIIDDMLLDHDKGFFSSIWETIDMEAFTFHSLGLMHFGAPGFVFDPWRYAPGPYLRSDRQIREINVNVYETTGIYEFQKTFWTKLQDKFGGFLENPNKTQDEMNVNFNLFDKTIWDVLNICAAIGDDIIVAAHPFALRNTIFFGKPYQPLKFDYNFHLGSDGKYYLPSEEGYKEKTAAESILPTLTGVGVGAFAGSRLGIPGAIVGGILGGVAGYASTSMGETSDQTIMMQEAKMTNFRMKTYRQYHIYDSASCILDNSISASEENMFNVVQGTCYEDGDLQTLDPIYADINIWPEKQKMAIVDTTVNMKGIDILNYIPLVWYLNDFIEWGWDKKVAMQIAQRALKDYMKEMYTGYLTVMGDASTKPYDQIILHDNYNKMYGIFEVREVIHTMNFESGFTTMITPDVYLVNRDVYDLQSSMSAYHGGTMIALWISMFAISRLSGYKGVTPMMSFLRWIPTQAFRMMRNSWGGQEIERFIRNNRTMQNIWNSRARTAIVDFYRRGRSFGSQMIRNHLGPGGTARTFINEVIQSMTNYRASGTPFKSAISGLVRNAGRILAALRNIARVAMLSNPIGWLVLVADILVMEALCKGVAEMFERILFERQACIVMPLKHHGRKLLAGMNGHRGGVYGDPADFVKSVMTHEWFVNFFGFLVGYDPTRYMPVGAGEDPINSDWTMDTSAADLKFGKEAAISFVQNKFVESIRVPEVVNEEEKSSYERLVTNQLNNYRDKLNKLSEYKRKKAEEENRDMMEKNEAQNSEEGEKEDYSDTSEETNSSHITAEVPKKGVDRSKYRVLKNNMKNKLVKLESTNTIHVHPMCDLPYIRKASMQALVKMSELYHQKTGKKLVITSIFRPHETTSWHCTGFAVDVDIPNMGIIGGKWRFPKGSKEKKDLTTMIECAIQAGFDNMYCNDADVIADINKRFPNISYKFWPGHDNHLHISTPTKNNSSPYVRTGKSIESQFGNTKGKYMVTESLLKQVGFRGVTPEMVSELNEAQVKFGITKKNIVRHFLAQCMHESGLGNFKRELWGPSDTQRGYEFRSDLGNNQPGDGYKFRGAGYIQLTGRHNYTKFAKYMKDNRILEEGCSYVSEKYPWTAAAHWWAMNGLNIRIDRDNMSVTDVTRAVNGGTRGLSERIRYYNKLGAIIV